METLHEDVQAFWGSIKNLLKWLICAAIMGIVVGVVGTLFSKCMLAATSFRLDHGWVVYLLPIGGLAIIGIYHLFRDQDDQGTNLVLSSIHSGSELPLKMAPCVFLGTVITHLVGGSAGREGAALQLGGSLGNQLGKWFHFDERDRKVVIMCGMSAAFAALFGTPMAAAVFAMEVVSIGIMHYAALVPCVFAAFIASRVALYAGITPERFHITDIPTIHFIGVGKVILLSVLCAVISSFFCILLHRVGHWYQKYLPNPYIRVAVGGAIVLGVTLLIGTRDYLGAGMNIIERAMEGDVRPSAFFFKMLLTALTLGAGFKGGEIVPSLFVGATFGALFASLVGSPPAICAAIGMVSLFCGVTNCPLSTLVLSFELFGLTDMPYFLIAIAISYMVSGYYSLYHEQKFAYSKEKTEYINTSAR